MRLYYICSCISVLRLRLYYSCAYATYARVLHERLYYIYADMHVTQLPMAQLPMAQLPMTQLPITRAWLS